MSGPPPPIPPPIGSGSGGVFGTRPTQETGPNSGLAGWTAFQNALAQTLPTQLARSVEARRAALSLLRQPRR